MLSSVSEVLNNSSGLLEEQVFGSIRAVDVPWIHITWESSREGISNSINLTLRAQVLPERLPPGRTWKKDPLWGQKQLVPGYRFNTQTAAESEMVVVQAFVDMARKFAPHFYEIDPRIGLSMCVPGFPESPLFDPPEGGLQSPTYCLSLYKRITEWCMGNVGQRHLYPHKHQGTECVFCHESVVVHEVPEEIVWGGGNTGWVHHRCAPWILLSTAPSSPEDL